MYIDLFSSFIMFMWIFYMFINNKTKKLWQYSVNKYRVQFFQMGSSSLIIFNNFKIDSEFFFIKPPPQINTQKWKIWILHMSLGLFYNDNVLLPHIQNTIMTVKL